MSTAPTPDGPSTRWKADPTVFALDGQHYRVMPGKKARDDLRIDWATTNGWAAVRMVTVFMLADFFYENEDYLFPVGRYRGGAMFLDAVRDACLNGWTGADERLEEQKRAKERTVNGTT